MSYKAETYRPGTDIVVLDFHLAPPSLEFLQKQVGGYIQVPPSLPGMRPGVKCYCDEDGLLKRLPSNTLATHRAIELGYNITHPLVGNVVFVEEMKDDPSQI